MKFTKKLSELLHVDSINFDDEILDEARFEDLIYLNAGNSLWTLPDQAVEVENGKGLVTDSVGGTHTMAFFTLRPVTAEDFE